VPNIQNIKFLPRFVSTQIFRTPLGVFLLVLFSLIIAFVNSKLGVLNAGIFTLLIMGVTILLLCIINPKFGYFLSLLIPFGGFELQRFLRIDIPLGLLIQLIFLFLALVMLFKRKIQEASTFQLIINPISFILILIFLHFLIQGFNPSMESITGWLFAIRNIAGLLLIYFVTLAIFDNIKFVKYFFFTWITLALISALYACYQEYFGLPDFILQYIHSDKLRFGLIFVNGKYRIFSLLSDPAAFGIFMASSFLVTFIIAIGERNNLMKMMLLLPAIIMLFASAFSGTRTAYAMVPAGLLLFILMTINNKKTLILLAGVSMVFAILLFGPIYGNSTINRIRSTFNGEDASLNVRDVNRASVQSYIYENPMGGGLMTTGDAGLEYNPRHQLAGFPPDSGYLQTVLEIGWLGFILLLVLFFMGMREGIKKFYRNKDPKLKYYYLAISVFIFSVSIASYAQVVIGQNPMSLFFCSSLAIVTKLNRFHD